MKKTIIQTSCSELLVDTAIQDAQEALSTFSALFKELNWGCSPPLTLKNLKALQGEEEHEDIMVFDADGNRAYLQFGGNGYITTGYRFDSHCNHGDTQCYPIFKAAIDRLGAELHSCDGGTPEWYEFWVDKPSIDKASLKELRCMLGLQKGQKFARYSCELSNEYAEARLITLTPKSQLPLLIGAFKSKESVKLLEAKMRGEDISNAISNKFKQ
jgi:hypothetical protein